MRKDGLVEKKGLGGWLDVLRSEKISRQAIDLPKTTFIQRRIYIHYTPGPG